MRPTSLLFLFTAVIATAASACDDMGAPIDRTYAGQLAIEAIEPTSGPSSGGTKVTLRGRRFCADPAVTFDGVAADGVEVISDTVALAIAPGHVLGATPVEIRCGGDRVVATAAFRYFATTVTFNRELDMPSVGRWRGFGDIDGDGMDDLFDVRKTEVVVFRNTGRNGFEDQPSVHLPMPAGESAELQDFPFKLSDFTGDGTVDILVFSNPVDPVTGDRVSNRPSMLRLFAGERGFAEVAAKELPQDPAVPYAVPRDMADLDGDGILDLIVMVATNVSLLEHRVDMLTGMGGISFGARRTLFEAPARKGAMFAGSTSAFNQDYGNDRVGPPARRDLDGDGIDDFVAITDWYPTEPVSTRVLTYVKGSPPGSVFSSVRIEVDREDLFFYDGDVLPDLHRIEPATASKATRSIRIRRATGFGTFEPTPLVVEIPCVRPACLEQDHPSTSRLAMARFDSDGDGDGEWALATGVGLEQSSAALEVLELGANTSVLQLVGEGARFYGMPRMLPTGERALVFDSLRPRAAYLSSTEEGPLAVRYTPPIFEVGDTSLGCAGDFDGDGIPDLVAARPQDQHRQDLIVYRGDGTGAFRATSGAVTFEADQATHNCTVGRFDGDDHLDLRIGSALFRNMGGATFEPLPIADAVPDWSYPIVMAQLDVNRDGLDDLVVQRFDADKPPLRRLLEAQGDGSFRATMELPVEGGSTYTDFDADGLPDKVDVSVGEGTEASHVIVSVSFGRRSAGTALELVPIPVFDAGPRGRQWQLPELAVVDAEAGPVVVLALGAARVYRLDVSRMGIEVRGLISDPNTSNLVAACNLRGRGRTDLLFSAEPGLLGIGDASRGAVGPLPRELRWLTVAEAHFSFGPWSSPPIRPVCFDADGDDVDDVLYTDVVTRRPYLLMNTSY